MENKGVQAADQENDLLWAKGSWKWKLNWKWKRSHDIAWREVEMFCCRPYALYSSFSPSKPVQGPAASWKLAWIRSSCTAGLVVDAVPSYMVSITAVTAAWSLKPGVSNLEPGTWNLEPGIWNLVPGTGCLEPGAWIWCLDPGAWNLVPVNQTLSLLYEVKEFY